MGLEEKTNLGILDRLSKRVMASIRVDLGKPIPYIRDRFEIYNWDIYHWGFVFKDSMGNVYDNIHFTREELDMILPSNPRALKEPPFNCLIDIYIECTLKEHNPNKEAIAQCLKNLRDYCDSKKRIP